MKPLSEKKGNHFGIGFFIDKDVAEAVRELKIILGKQVILIEHIAIYDSIVEAIDKVFGNLEDVKSELSETKEKKE